MTSKHKRHFPLVQTANWDVQCAVVDYILAQQRAYHEVKAACEEYADDLVALGWAVVAIIAEVETQKPAGMKEVVVE